MKECLRDGSKGVAREKVNFFTVGTTVTVLLHVKYMYIYTYRGREGGREGGREEEGR